MAATANGVDVASVKRLAGTLGLEALDEMIEDGLLNRSADGRVFYSYKSWALGNIDDALMQVKHSVDHFDKSLVGSEGASLMHATASISKDKIPELSRLIKSFMKDVNDLKNAEGSEGNIHFFCNLLYSLYDKDSWIQAGDPSND